MWCCVALSVQGGGLLHHSTTTQTNARGSSISDPNRNGSDGERQYIARLVCKVTHISVETVRLVRELADKVDLLAAVGVGASASEEMKERIWENSEKRS